MRERAKQRERRRVRVRVGGKTKESDQVLNAPPPCLREVAVLVKVRPRAEDECVQVGLGNT